MNFEQALDCTGVKPIPLEGFGRMYTEAQVKQLLAAADGETQSCLSSLDRLRHQIGNLRDEFSYTDTKIHNLESENYDLRERIDRLEREKDQLERSQQTYGGDYMRVW